MLVCRAEIEGTMIVWSLVLLALLIACSFLVSGSETALFALTAHDRAAFAASPSSLKRAASRLMLRPQRVLMTVLIVNTAVNVAIFAVSYVSFGPESGGSRGKAAIGGAVSLVAVILVGEIIPKAVALASARRVAPWVAPFIDLLQWVTAPVRFLLQVSIVAPIMRLLTPARRSREVSADDLADLVQLSAHHAIISTSERDMLRAVVTLPGIAVRTVMVPRVKVVAAPIDADLATFRKLFAETGLKKVPVYGRDLDDVRGLLYARDLYTREGEPIDALLQPVRFVPDGANLIQLIEHFRTERSQLAIVVDEYGGVAGLVTLEDVLEVVVGDIEDGEYRTEEPLVERIDTRSYRLAGAINLRPWRSALGLEGRFVHVDTIGGAVAAALGRLPRVGDTVRFGNVALTVESLDGQLAGSVRIDMDTAVDAEREGEPAP